MTDNSGTKDGDEDGDGVEDGDRGSTNCGQW